MTKKEFRNMVKSGPVLLDGATGSWLRGHGMPVGVSTEQWVNEHPDTMMLLEKQYIQAGSQIIYAPTFSANRYTLKGMGLSDEISKLNLENVAIAKSASGGKALVAGDLTTTGKPMEQTGETTYDTLLDVYREQIRLLKQAGVDLLVAETLMSLDEAMVICDAAQSECKELPIMCSFSCEGDGRLYFGGNIIDAAVTLQEMDVCAVGVNCSVGPDQLESVVETLKEQVNIPLIVKPNAGMPVIDQNGQAQYPMDSETFSNHMMTLVSKGASIVGGCCGTTPEYIEKLHKELLTLNT